MQQPSCTSYINIFASSHSSLHFRYATALASSLNHQVSPLDRSQSQQTPPRREATANMVSSRKRGRQEMEAAEPPKEPSLLELIRNMWEFANLVQWIFIFGRVVKIDENLDIEVHSNPSPATPYRIDVFSASVLMLLRVGP